VQQAKLKIFDPFESPINSKRPNNSSRSIQNGLSDLLSQVSGQITGQELELPAHFTFTWNNFPFAVQLSSYKNNDIASINLVGDLGFIPYSAEDYDLRQKMRIAFASLVRNGDFHISHGNRIQLSQQTDFTGDLTAKRILQVITFTLLDIKDKLDDIAEEFPHQH